MNTPSEATNWNTHTPNTIIAGFDFGTNTSCIIASQEGSQEIFLKQAIPTVVGYPKELMVAGVLPQGQELFFGNEALKHRAHLNLVRPIQDGIIHDMKASKDFVKYLSTLLNPNKNAAVKAVIGIPANASEKARENMREVVSGYFDQVILVPEPFLAAMGYRNESRLGDPQYIDPIRSSLFIDIGAGTTDLCIIQGYLPTHEDQTSIPFAGDNVDQILANAIHEQYPEINLTQLKVRSIKESFSYVGGTRNGIQIKVLVGGKPKQIEVGPSVAQACNPLLDKIFEATVQLISRCDSDSVETILQNIIMTGGGSRIQGIAQELQTRLEAEGFASPTVKTVGEHYKGFVAVGAWKTATSAKQQQWQRLLTSTQAQQQPQQYQPVGV